MRDRNLICRPKAQGGATPLRFSLLSGDSLLLSCSCGFGALSLLLEVSL